MKKIIINCPCGKTREIRAYPSKIGRTKYCSQLCKYKYRIRSKGLSYILHKENPTSFKKGNIPANKGVASPLRKENPGYDALHSWVERWAGKAKEGMCRKCGGHKNMQWANKSHQYKRDLTDWIRLCKSCHFKYDRKTGWGIATKLFPQQLKRNYT